MTDETERPVRDKAELLARIEPSWTELQRFIARTEPEKLTEPLDAEGWSVKDHLSHIAAWERSMLYLLQRRPRHEGLGVSEELFLADDLDALNAAIHDQTKDRSLDEALADLRWTHEQFLAEIDRHPDASLQQPYSHFLPHEPGDEKIAPVMGWLAGDTYEHYDEHRGWMEAIAAQQV